MVIILLLFSSFVLSQSADIELVKTISSIRILNSEVKGNVLILEGKNNFEFYDISSIENPIKLSETESTAFKCGDFDWGILDHKISKEKNIAFASTLCLGIRAYDFTDFLNPVCIGKVDLNNVKAIELIENSEGIFLLSITNDGILYYSDFTSPPGGCNAVPAIMAGNDFNIISDIKVFSYNSKIYMSASSNFNGFSLYDITNFPQYTKLFSKPENSYDSYFYNGLIYINSRNNGLKIYDLNGNLFANYDQYNFSYATGVSVDENFIYLSLGQCSQTGGFEILDKITLNSVKGSYVPEDCNNKIFFNIYPYKKNGNNYFFAADLQGLDIYKISYNCLSNLGDINENQMITAHDASLILQNVAGLINFNFFQKCRADVNINGQITALDGSYVLQCCVGFCSNLPPDFQISCESMGNCQLY